MLPDCPSAETCVQSLQCQEGGHAVTDYLDGAMVMLSSLGISYTNETVLDVRGRTSVHLLGSLCTVMLTMSV